MVNAETFAGGWYKIISDYLILSHFCDIGSLVFGICELRFIMSGPGALLQPWKNVASPKGVLFGYPITSKKRDGIMVIAETFAGGWYNVISDYLIISYYIPVTSSQPFPMKNRDRLPTDRVLLQKYGNLLPVGKCKNVFRCMWLIKIYDFQSPKSSRMFEYPIFNRLN